MEKTWVIKETDQFLYRHTLRRATRGLPFADEKNPARAFSLSLFLWGGGQGYSGQRGKSALFQVFMLVFLVGIAFSFLYGKELLVLLQSYGISYARVFLTAELVFFCTLLFWMYNASDAYHTAVKARRVPFHGVENRAVPMLCSLLIPGWGQFVNGQPLKGGIFAGFSVLGIFSLVTVPAVLLCWPSLEVSRARSIIEAIFAVTVLYAPLIPVIWLFSSYDALRVSLNDIKKASVLDRIIFAINRVRLEGWVRSASAPLRTVVVLAFLAFLVIKINHHYFNGNYFSGNLAVLQSWLHKQGMTLVPDLIGRLLSGTALAGK
jgi:TM2 domain-containing membrane protein YozV